MHILGYVIYCVYMKMGRPTDYTKELGDAVCEWLISGKSLSSFCLQDGAPSVASIYRWLRSHADFCEAYVRAREEQADTLADDMQLIADTSTDANLGRLRVETRKWIASKLKPKKYGDKVDLTTNGKDLPAPILGGLSVSGTTGSGPKEE